MKNDVGWVIERASQAMYNLVHEPIKGNSNFNTKISVYDRVMRPITQVHINVTRAMLRDER